MGPILLVLVQDVLKIVPNALGLENVPPRITDLVFEVIDGILAALSSSIELRKEHQEISCVGVNLAARYRLELFFVKFGGCARLWQLLETQERCSFFG